MILWQRLGQYEYEAECGADEYEAKCGADGIMCYTGWYRCVGGKLADGRWPQWNQYNGKKRFQ